MTVPKPATPGSGSVRAQIADVVTSALSLHVGDELPEAAAEVVDVLVPLVDRLRAEAKAEALEEAADDVLPAPFGDDDADDFVKDHIRDYLRDRAAAYRTNPSSEETHRGR